MRAGTQTLAAIANQWFARFEHALAQRDEAALAGLFAPESYWRDVLALTWRIDTVSRADSIARNLLAHAERARPAGFGVDPDRTPPRHATRAAAREFRRRGVVEVASITQVCATQSVTAVACA